MHHTDTTPRRRRTRLLVVLAAVAALVTAVLPATSATGATSAATASAATAPPPVSGITVTERTAHRVTISYLVPAAYYSPGGGGVVRVTRGHTPAASPTSGYAVPVTGRTARTTLVPSLTPNVAYTFAVWVRVGSAYSAGRTITVVTRPDVVTELRSAASVTPPSYDLGHAQVRLTWRNPTGPLKAVRIVRNTAATTTGGTVTTLPGTATSFTDPSLPASVCGGRTTGCSTAPVHYWVIPESTTGGFADRYVRSDVVVGSRTITGTVSQGSSGIVALCCQNLFDAENALVAHAAADPAVAAGAFTIHVPPGVYAVCTFADRPPRNQVGTCWNAAGAGSEDVWWEVGGDPSPTIDVRTAPSYNGVRL
ncbi:hypothetical protein [Terrabacter aeriphilus]|uniref:hypothetical protein n=1 Tax=Terrabacter aeriphilus TaxID=515662 RepID=UPI0031E96D6F